MRLIKQDRIKKVLSGEEVFEIKDTDGTIYETTIADMISDTAPAAFTLIDGNGTTANGSAVDLGGDASADIDMDMFTHDWSIFRGTIGSSYSAFIDFRDNFATVMEHRGNTRYSRITFGEATNSIEHYNTSTSAYSAISQSYSNTEIYTYDGSSGVTFRVLSDTLYINELPSGADQSAAGVSAREMWRTASHATLPDGVVMIGI